MRDSGGELLQYRLVIEPRAARRARHVVGSLLEGWRLGGLADDVVSCVSELVTNVYEHTAKSATAELSISWVPGSSLTVEVRDQDSRLPRRDRTAELGVLPFALIDSDAVDWRIMQLAEAGRGLALVGALCDRLTGNPTMAAARWSAATGGSRLPPTLPAAILSPRTVQKADRISAITTSVLAARTARPRPASAQECVFAGQGPPNIQPVRPSPASSHESVRKL